MIKTTVASIAKWAAFVTAACGAAGAPRPTPLAEGWKEFVSVSAGYVAYYPPSWRLLGADLPTLYVVNFPASRQERGNLLPPGGASIAVVPPRRPTNSIDAWIAHDIRGTNERIRSAIQLKRAVSGTSIQVTEVVSTWGLRGDENESMGCYFEISGKLLAVQLDYLRGDQNARQYAEVLHRIVEEIRLLNEPK